jgi:hypothetical protein
VPRQRNGAEAIDEAAGAVAQGLEVGKAGTPLAGGLLQHERAIPEDSPTGAPNTSACSDSATKYRSISRWGEDKRLPLPDPLIDDCVGRFEMQLGNRAKIPRTTRRDDRAGSFHHCVGRTLRQRDSRSAL